MLHAGDATSPSSTRTSGTEGINTFDRYVSPWLTLVDDGRFQATVDRVEALRTVGDGRLPHAGDHRSAQRRRGHRRHAPFAVGDRSPAEPDQAVLEQIQRALLAMAN